jgi:prevent-host-death family protein
MKGTATIRDLRNRFTDVRKRLEADGEVVVTERGKPRYRLMLYKEPRTKPASEIDYWARLTSYQPRPLSRTQARKLHEENRGER